MLSVVTQRGVRQGLARRRMMQAVCCRTGSANSAQVVLLQRQFRIQGFQVLVSSESSLRLLVLQGRRVCVLMQNCVVTWCTLQSYTNSSNCCWACRPPLVCTCTVKMWWAPGDVPWHFLWACCVVDVGLKGGQGEGEGGYQCSANAPQLCLNL